eukprot:3106948-Amphidinium_carterae.1
MGLYLSIRAKSNLLFEELKVFKRPASTETLRSAFQQIRTLLLAEALEATNQRLHELNNPSWVMFLMFCRGV